jgi:Beta-glucan synthesis-associated protein SKN1/KRE6/Sbg1
MLGNLARATYVGSSDFVWPYSFSHCEGKVQKTQLINACDKAVHYGLIPNEGRGSPEIDILEAMQGEAGPLPSTHIQKPYQSISLQVAPGLDGNRPVLGLRPQPVSKRIFVIKTRLLYLLAMLIFSLLLCLPVRSSIFGIVT